jgi:hypothetical protein
MKVIAKYKTVQVTYPNGEVVNVMCKSLIDALEYSTRLTKVLPFRERASKDKSYLTEFYDYLKSRGLIETDLYKRQLKMTRKYQLVCKLSKLWA